MRIQEGDDWVRGKVPRIASYKKLNLTFDDAMDLALDGAATAFAYFGAKLYFTQALTFGAAISGKYHHIGEVAPSQYGKSWLMAMIDIYLASQQKAKVNIGAGDGDNKILGKIPEVMLGACQEIKDLATISIDKFEKMNLKLSKDGLGFSNGGEVRSFSFGTKYTDIGSNKAIGLEGQLLNVDESALIGDEFDEAFSRVLKKSEKTGQRGVVIEISNPHKKGRFEQFMKKATYDDDELVVWFGLDTLLEEGAETQEGIDKRFPDKTKRAYAVNILGEFVEATGIVFSEFHPTIDGEPWHVLDERPFDIMQLGVKRYIGFDWGFGHDPAVLEWIAVTPPDIFGEQHYLVYREMTDDHTTPEQWIQRIVGIVEDEPVDGFVMPGDAYFQKNDANTIADRMIAEVKRMKDLEFKNLRLPIVRGVGLSRKERVGRQSLLHSLLAEASDGEPFLRIMSSCIHLIRTLPELPYNDTDPETLETKHGVEDHWYDAATYGLYFIKQKPLHTRGNLPLERVMSAPDRIVVKPAKQTRDWRNR